MPLFQWTQVLLLCALCLVIGYVAASSRARWRRNLKPPEQQPAGRLFPRSHETPATRVLEEQFHAGKLGFDESLELADTYRRQGDIQGAIDIHQSLYGRPGLHWRNMQRAQFELARDFFQAGILGRAEDLLRSLVAQNGEQTEEAVRLLLKIYQQEQDWEEAVELFESHRSLAQGDLRWEHVHMLCEQAETMLLRQPDRARVMARQALQVLEDSQRPVLLLMRLAMQQQRWREFNRLVQSYLTQPESRIDLFRPIARNAVLQYPEQQRTLLNTLQKYNHQPEVRLLQGELLFESGLSDQGIQLVESVPLNEDTLAWRLDHLAHCSGDEDLKRLSEELKASFAQQNRYQCSHCGFESAAHYWHCPQCERWETLQPMRYQKSGKLLI
ncbi:hypothetical protein E4656_05175 [Natronospirillum operosum]|uniref:LapB rubredoxin metal binding domain-containing protein n=1 Tax=Natronospirillum operosum TaxID=2759953 RepID=A0A4Z0WFJ3_9GAMM|nr:hypothetical protein [Natronospirillum operosum]TGG95800.1 hypothetical protein E4656_05175 [Natronospirillum operosum]